MKKILLVARREFLATVGNKGFIIGLLVMPALIAVAFLVGPRILNARSPEVRGDVAIVDPTSRVAAELRATLDPGGIRARRAEDARRTLRLANLEGAASQQALDRAVGQIPTLRLLERPPDADVQREKQWLLDAGPDDRHFALIVIRPDAVVRREGLGEFGSYDLYVSRSLDDNTESVVHDALRQAFVNARLKAGNLDAAAVEATMRVQRPGSVIVGPGGEQQASRGFTRMLPFLMGLLLFLGVIVGGQTLMTSTIEEKSSRVVEVLLASISPFQLMAGKLIGQLGVGLVAMSIYVGLGLLALWSFAMFGLIDPMLIVYLLVFFLITYMVFGALMIAIGAAVNQVAEAQSLLTPVMLLLMIPYMLAPMIGRAPNSTFSVAISFIPPFNAMAMMVRLASDTPPPAWQVWATAVVGIGAALATVWFAGKVFKIGLLMHGKPPNFATLIRWARAA